MIKKLLMACGICFLESVLFFSIASAQSIFALKSYTADLVTTTARDTFTSKIYHKGEKERREGTKRSDITITRFDKRMVWMLMPQRNTYMEISLDKLTKENPNLMAALGNLKAEKEFMATDVVDGHPCKKYHLTIITDGKKEKGGFTWEASDLNNLPVKYQSEDNKWTSVWKNIQQGDLPDSLFEVPPGYTKMDMPVFGGNSKMTKKPQE